MTSVSAISPNFQGNYITENLKKTYTDPTDVHNSEAVISGTIATGGISGAAAVASRMRSMRNAVMSAQSVTKKAVSMKAKNLSMLGEFTQNISKFFNNSKATRWISRGMSSPFGKKVIGGAIGLTAIGITAAQLFSFADMAHEAVKTYSD